MSAYVRRHGPTRCPNCLARLARAMTRLLASDQPSHFTVEVASRDGRWLDISDRVVRREAS